MFLARKVLTVFALSSLFSLAAAENKDPDFEPLSLGALLPLTGPYAAYGHTIRKGVDLAIQDLNKDGQSVMISYQDIVVPGAEAVTALRRLLQQDQVKAVVANFFNPVMRIVAPDLKKSGTFAFHTAESDEGMLAIDAPIYATTGRIRNEVEEGVKFAINSIKAKNAAILSLENPFGEEYASHFKRLFEAAGGEILYQGSTPLGVHDLRSELSRVASKKPEVLLLAYFGPMLDSILKTVKELKINIPIISVYEAEEAGTMGSLQQSFDGQVNIFVPDIELDTEANFYKSFQKQFNEEPTILSANAYDTTILFTRVFRSCGGDSQCLTRKIRETKDFSGASGIFSLDTDRSTTRVFRRKILKNGRFQPT